MYSGWHRDGGEIYYVAADGGVMAIEIRTGPTFEFEKPTLLFRLSEAVPVFPSLANVSRDGERIVIAVPHAPTLQQITVLDRQGSVLTEVGEPGRYRNPALSPDGTRVAVQRIQAGNAEIWTFDVDSGAGTALTNDQPFDHFRTPVWSPDSSRVAYNSLRGGGSGIDIKAWNGTGDAEQLFQYTPGAALLVTDWSSDGRFLTFQSGRVGGVLYIVPLNGDEEALEREAMEWLRDEYLVVQARFSPDVRFIAYLSDEIEDEIFQVYVGLFDASEPDGGRGGATPVQVSHAGALGMTSWRPDGRELYYMTPDWEVMVVDVTTTPTFQAGTPRLLFTLPGPLRGDPRQWPNVSPDGERFVFAIDVPVALRAE
jgi:serine/threonine-protein kinase